MEKEFSRLSSVFYKLEKKTTSGIYLVCEFHSVVNGNRYIKQLEEWEDRSWKCNCSETKLAPGEAGIAFGNEQYQMLKERGFTFAGVWEMDVLGRKRKVK